MKSIDLFAGVGGLAMGISRAGFEHAAIVEWNNEACETVRANKTRGLSPVLAWPLRQMDVRQLDFKELGDDIDLLAGGPPCQPFSIGGKHRGHKDDRNMFPEMVRAVRELKPRAILIENVRGLIRESFSKYFGYIILQVTYPDIVQKKDESWMDHLSRLERHHTRGRREEGLHYKVLFQTLNAAAFGVPQRRERVFIVAFRCDQNVSWAFPTPTHSEESLIWSQWITGEYWDRHHIPKSKRPKCAERIKFYLDRSMIPPAEEPFMTVRDAICGLPDPTSESNRIINHRFIPGARAYTGHTGSLIDEPAKTLKAGDHGVPGGENMIAMPDGVLRYFTVRESARLQTFPDDYFFPRSWTESMRQLGNAVPVKLGEILARNIKSSLNHANANGVNS